MKSKKLVLNNQLNDKKVYFIYFFAISGLVIFLLNVFYGFYLHNPTFHMFIQSKGLFL